MLTQVHASVWLIQIELQMEGLHRREKQFLHLAESNLNHPHLSKLVCLHHLQQMLVLNASRAAKRLSHHVAHRTLARCI